jgi:iron complex outermembrane receptor protein
MKDMLKTTTCLLAILLTCNIQLRGQEADADLYDLSLEELMNIEIVAASKKAESAFESPLSSSVVTRDEIIASGVTTIEEALRLVPGMLVREETNGNFDPHIRGNDNIPPGNFMIYTENSMTLVMIDGRPVYNYGIGATFWEALPVSLVDVERIEVVRGPSSALYGPNAALGVINIITTEGVEKTAEVRGNVQIGTENSGIYDLSVGTSLADGKLQLRISGNLENRNRSQETYYAFALGEYVEGDQVPEYTSPTMQTNPGRRETPKKAKERKGLNAYLTYSPSQEVQLDLSAGLQDSYSQSVFQENLGTPMIGRDNESKYFYMNANVHGLSAQFGYSTGVFDIAVSSEEDNRFDFNTTTANLEYDLNFGKLTLRPGLNYQHSTNNDLPYAGGEQKGFLNADRSLSNFGYFVRADYSPTEKLRLVAAIRGDDFNISEKDYLSYQLATSYNLNEHNLLRAVVSQANRGTFMADSYSNYQTGNGFTDPPYVLYQGNEDLKLPTVRLFEVGYRGVIAPMLTLDVELFHSITTDIISYVPTFVGVTSELGLNVRFDYENLDLESFQTGVTFNLTYVPSDKLQLRTYATVQRTQLKNYDKSLTPVIIDPINNIYDLPVTERMDTEHRQTPNVYGGVAVNFRPIDKLNLFANTYFMTSHIYRHDYAAYEETKGQTEVPGFAVFNVKASYQLYKNNSVFINARNMFGTQEQFGFADEVGGLYLLGVNLYF